MFLPGAISKLVLAALPPELGRYVLQSGEPFQVRHAASAHTIEFLFCYVETFTFGRS